MYHPADPSIDPAVAGQFIGSLLLSPTGVLGVVCLCFLLQAGVRILTAQDRRRTSRAKPTTWTRF